MEGILKPITKLVQGNDILPFLSLWMELAADGRRFKTLWIAQINIPVSDLAFAKGSACSS
jgi:hypothetical protein